MRYLSAAVAMSEVIAAAALFGVSGCAHAEPSPQPGAAPQPDTPCAENLAGAMTRLDDGKTTLVCIRQTDDYQWTMSTSPYPLSDRWLTYGPELKLHGQGLRNPEIMSGHWTGNPMGPETVCKAEQVAVLGPGQTGPPQTAAGEPGQPLQLEVSRTLFNITLSGDCLWQKGT